MNELIFSTAGDGRSQIKLLADRGTVWLTRLGMAAAFKTTKQNAAKHLTAVFAEHELSPDSVVNRRPTTANLQKLQLGGLATGEIAR